VQAVEPARPVLVELPLDSDLVVSRHGHVLISIVPVATLSRTGCWRYASSYSCARCEWLDGESRNPRSARRCGIPRSDVTVMSKLSRVPRLVKGPA
jgi:hypothetical protein